jgi:hypothetical protein
MKQNREPKSKPTLVYQNSFDSDAKEFSETISKNGAGTIGH